LSLNEKLVSNFAFKFNLYRYTAAAAVLLASLPPSEARAALVRVVENNVKNTQAQAANQNAQSPQNAQNPTNQNPAALALAAMSPEAAAEFLHVLDPKVGLCTS
jgi:hypothetical protein